MASEDLPLSNGPVNVEIAAVETQGRGRLHTHIYVWTASPAASAPAGDTANIQVAADDVQGAQSSKHCLACNTRLTV